MSTRSLRARLDRLMRTINATMQEEDHVHDFIIDRALANALRKDYKRLIKLEKARPYRWPPTNEGVTEEERTLRARFAEKARAISCPANYGFNEVWDDRERLRALEDREKLPRWHAHLKRNRIKDQDAYEAQLIARIAAFDESPEGRARSRISELGGKRIELLSDAEQSELENLLASYPESDVHPKDPMKRNCEAWSAAAGFAEAKIRKRM